MLTYHLLVWKDLAPKTRATKEKSSVDDNTEASEHAVGHVVKSERSAKHLAEYDLTSLTLVERKKKAANAPASGAVTGPFTGVTSPQKRYHAPVIDPDAPDSEPEPEPEPQPPKSARKGQSRVS